MKKKYRLPKFIRYWAKEMMEKKGYDEEKAIRIAISNAEKLGYLRKGTLKMTKKGLEYSKRKVYGKKI